MCILLCFHDLGKSRGPDEPDDLRRWPADLVGQAVVVTVTVTVWIWVPFIPGEAVAQVAFGVMMEVGAFDMIEPVALGMVVKFVAMSVG